MLDRTSKYRHVVGMKKHEDIYLACAFCVPLLIALVSYWFAIYFPIIAAATAKSGGEQWLGFFGNLIGAGVTLLAAAIAWRAVRSQIDAQREEMLMGVLAREEDRAEQEWRALRYCHDFLARSNATFFYFDPDVRQERLEEIGLVDVEVEIYHALTEGLNFRLEQELVDTMVSALYEYVRTAYQEVTVRADLEAGVPSHLTSRQASDRVQFAHESLSDTILDIRQEMSVVESRRHILRSRIDATISGLAPK